MCVDGEMDGSDCERFSASGLGLSTGCPINRNFNHIFSTSTPQSTMLNNPPDHCSTKHFAAHGRSDVPAPINHTPHAAPASTFRMRATLRSPAQPNPKPAIASLAGRRVHDLPSLSKRPRRMKSSALHIMFTRHEEPPPGAPCRQPRL